MEDTLLGVISCCTIGLLLMLIFSASNNTRKSHKQIIECDHDWVYDGENGSKAGAFYYCKKCGKNKYIPYKDLMAMSEEEYKFWTTRPKSKNVK